MPICFRCGKEFNQNSTSAETVCRECYSIEKQLTTITKDCHACHKQIGQETRQEIAKSYYCIPRWCKMHPHAHLDGIGGCWSISQGSVLAGGESYCKSCEFYSKKQSVK